jgi:endonuclease/exonuclease/phosphatase (EEP) superfamily protein YafD
MCYSTSVAPMTGIGAGNWRSGVRRIRLMNQMLNRLRKVARIAWFIALIVTWAGALVGAFGQWWPPTGIFIHFSLQFCWIAVLLALAALLRRRWRAMAVAAVLALWQLWVVWPQHAGSSNIASASASTSTSTSTTKLKIVSFNTWYVNTHYESMLLYLRNSDADVIGLVEVIPALKDALAELHDIYPYQADCIGTVPKCEEVLLSRWPLKNVSAERLEDRRPVVVRATLDLPGGPIDVAVTHLSSPLSDLLGKGTDRSPFGPPEPMTKQQEQAARLGRYFAKLGPDAIMMGDFNATPWSAIMTELRAAGGWPPDFNLAPSWPRWLSAPLRLPIDHIWTRGRVETIAFDTGPALRSDHLPVVADVVIHDAKAAP